MANIYKSLASIGANLQEIGTSTDTENNNQTQYNDTNEPYIYDGDTTYSNGNGSRMLGVDTPEMSSAIAMKAERLAKAKESKIGSFASKATAGEAAKMEAQLSVLDANGIDGDGTVVKKDAFGRDIVQNDAYKNRMIEKGYAVPTFFDGENDMASVDAMNKAKEEKRGLWADPEYAKEMAGLVDKRILGSNASEDIKNAAEYAKYNGTLTREDYMNRDTGESGFIDGVQAYLTREIAPVKALWQNLGNVDAAKKQMEYEKANADTMVGYDAGNAGLLERMRRAASSGTEDVANKVAGLVGEGIESIGEGLRGIKNLDEKFLENENKRLAKYGENTSEFRNNIIDTLKVDETGSWLENVGKSIQKDTVEHVKQHKGSTLSGYSTKNVSDLQSEIKDTIEKEGFVSAIGKAMTDSRSLEVLAGSLPEMMALAASVGTMAVTNVNHNINIGEDKLQRPMTSGEKVRSAAVSIVGTYLDRLGDKLAISGMTPAKSALKATVENAPAAVKNALASTYGKGILRIGEAPLRLTGAGLVEGVTEYGQTLAETAAQNPYVFDKGFTSEDISEAEVAGVLGTTMGGQIATPKIVKEEYDKLKSKPQGVANKVISDKEDTSVILEKPNEERVNVAKAFANNEISVDSLGSDKVSQLRDIVTILEESNSLDVNMLAKVEDRIRASIPEADVKDIVETGRDIGALKKTANAVSKEVSEGSRGFLTYYDSAMKAKAGNDEVGFEGNVAKMESFLKSQKDKLETFKRVEQNIINEYITMAEQSGKTLEQVYNDVKNNNDTMSYTYGDKNKPAKVKKNTVLEKYLYHKDDSSFSGGVYKYMNMVQNEVAAMDRLSKKLTEATPVVSTEEVSETPVAKKEMPAWINEYLDEKMKSVTDEKSKAELVDSINKSIHPKTVEYRDELLAKVEEMYTPVSVESNAEEATPEVDTEAIIDSMPIQLKRFVNANMKFIKNDEDKAKLKEKVQAFKNPEAVKYVPQIMDMIDSYKVADTKNGSVKEPISEVKVEDVVKAYARRDELLANREEAVVAEDKAKIDEIDTEIKEIGKVLNKNNNKYAKEMAKVKVTGPGVAPKYAENVLESSKLTGINIADIGNVDREVNEVKAVAEPVLTKDGKLNGSMAKSPAMYLIFNEDGSVNKRVAVALGAAKVNYMLELDKELARMTDEEFQERFGTVNIYDPDVMSTFQDKATPLRFEIEKIGADVMANLGIKVKSDVSLSYEQSLKADLGMTVIAMLAKDKYVKVAKISKKDNNSPYAVGMGTNMNLEGLEYRAMDYENTYGIEATGSRTYKLETPKHNRKVDVKNHPYMEATKEQASAINKQEKMAYSLNEGYDVITEVFSKEELKKALGKGKKWFSKYNIDAQKSIDREIETSVESMYNLARLNVNGVAPKIWFKWFLSKNGRFNLDSTTVNPQTDKLHRFLVTAESAKSEVSVEDIKDVMNEESTSEKAIAMKYAIVQAFDGVKDFKGGKLPAIDKSKKSTVEKAANVILKMSDEELVAMMKDMAANNKGHIGHAAIAVATVRKLQKREAFTTSMTVEFDGLTNGFSFRSMQFPLGAYDEWLPRVGVIDGDSEVGSMAEMKEDGMEDTYEVLGSRVVFGDIEEDMTVLKIVAEAGGVPDLKDKKAIRGLLKSPVMVFNYGAGKEAIVAAIVRDLTVDAIEAIAKDKNVVRKLGLADNVLKEKSMEAKELAPVVNALRSQISQVYAMPIALALQTEFEETVKLNQAMNAAFGLMYQDMKSKIAEKVREIKKGTVLPSKVEMDEIVREVMKDVGPIISGPNSKGVYDRIFVASRGVEDVANLIGNSADSIVGTAKIGDENLKSAIVVRGLGSPGAAGGVLPIHTADGNVQGRAMAFTEGGYLGVHDAQVVGLGQMNSVLEYNKAWYKVNKEYSIIDGVVEALSKVDDGVIGKENTMKALQMYQGAIQANREDIFQRELKIGQMVGLPGSMYTVNVKKDSGKIQARKPVEKKVEEPVVVEEPKIADMSTEEKLDELLKAYESGKGTTEGGGHIENVQQDANRYRVADKDEDVQKGGIRKGVRSESIADVLPKLDRQVRTYRNAYNKYYGEFNRNKPVRELMDNLMSVLASVEADARVAESIGLVPKVNEVSSVSDIMKALNSYGMNPQTTGNIINNIKDCI